jgi:pantetheine-phosphate adenylyltransferase
MTKAVYAGSFDPITNGHLDIIRRATRTFGHVYVVIAHNPKKTTLFNLSERADLVRGVIEDLGFTNVSVSSHRGLIVEFCHANEASVMIRGLRAVTDFEYELSLAHINHDVNGWVETVFFPTHPENSFISSSMVKELASHGANVAKYIHPIVAKALEARMKERP